MRAIILAAGFATRWYPLTEDKAKGLLEYQGKPVMTYIINEIKKVPAIDEITIATNKKFFEDYINWRETLDDEKNIFILSNDAMQPEERLGALGDLYNTIKTMHYEKEDLLIMGCDYLVDGLGEMYDEFVEEGNSLVSITGMSAKGQTIINNQGKLIEFKEKQKISGIHTNPIYMLNWQDFFKCIELNVPLKFQDYEAGTDSPGYLIQFLVEKGKHIYSHPDLKVGDLETKLGDLK